MSMPSSRLDVATRPLSRPDLSSSSIWSRRSRDSEPWWAFTSSSCTGGVPSASAGAVLALPVQLVEAGGQPLGQAAGVDEDQRGAVLLHQLEQPRVHGRPDRAPDRAGRGRARRGLVDHGAELGHVVDRDDHLDLERLAHAGVDDRDRPRPTLAAVGGRSVPPRNRAISSSGRCVADRPMRCGDGAAACAHPVVEPLEGDGQVAAPLGGGQRVDLVDDHGLDAAQRLAGRRGEHQVERLGRGDEDVGRVADEPAPLVGGGVAGAHADGRLRVGLRRAARRPGGCPAAGCAGSSRRRPPAPAAATRRASRVRCVRSVGGGPADERVDPPQEGGQRLARAGGRQDQRVLAARDGRPALRLRRRGLRERGARTRPAPPARTARADPAQPPRQATDGP